jgi:hypothetical protein
MKAEREEVVSLSRRQRAGCFHLVFAGGVLCCLLMFRSAQAAELTSGHYRSFQEEGLEARVDLARLGGFEGDGLRNPLQIKDSTF